MSNKDFQEDWDKGLKAIGTNKNKSKKNMEHNKEEVEKLIKRLKEEPKLYLYDYNLTDLVRYLLIKVEELESKLK